MAREILRGCQRVESLSRLGNRGLSRAPRVPFLVREEPPSCQAEDDEKDDETDLLEPIDRDQVPVDVGLLLSGSLSRHGRGSSFITQHSAVFAVVCGNR